MAVKLTDRCYKVDFSSILKECFSEEDVADKIAFFRENVCSTPPPIWEDFLRDVRLKINPFTAEENYLVFKLKDSQELRNILTRDSVLQNLVLKAENYKILILKHDYTRVRKKLEEYGYLLT